MFIVGRLKRDFAKTRGGLHTAGAMFKGGTLKKRENDISWERKSKKKNTSRGRRKAKEIS